MHSLISVKTSQGHHCILKSSTGTLPSLGRSNFADGHPMPHTGPALQGVPWLVYCAAVDVLKLTGSWNKVPLKMIHPETPGNPVRVERLALSCSSTRRRLLVGALLQYLYARSLLRLSRPRHRRKPEMASARSRRRATWLPAEDRPWCSAGNFQVRSRARKDAH